MIKNILVAYDGSDQAEKAVDFAAEFATKFGATIHLVHVITHHHAPAVVEIFARGEHVHDADKLEIEKDWARNLRPLETKMADRGVKEVHSAVLRGDPAQMILKHAGEVSADVIVTGRLGRGPLKRALMGSVSSKVQGLAECSVITVK